MERKLIKRITEHKIHHFLKYNNNKYTQRELIDIIVDDDMFTIESSHIHRALRSLIIEDKIKREKIGRSYLYHARQHRTLSAPTMSIDPTMTFGVEFEFGCDVPDDVFKSLFRDLSIKEGITGDSTTYISSNNTNDYSKWTLTYDSSIETRMEGQFELISPILSGMQGLIDLKKVTNFINELKAAGLAHQNNSCGTHVHHGTFKVSIDKLIENFTSNQEHFNKFVKRNRVVAKSTKSETRRTMSSIYHSVYNRHINFRDMLDGHYVAATKSDYYIAGHTINWSHSKYFNLRLNNYEKSGTIEMRQLEGITNFTKIAAWVVIGQQVIKSSNNKVAVIRKKKTISEFIAHLGFDAQLAGRLNWT